MLVIESKLEHNTGGTGLGKFYVAKITGEDEKYGLKREFLNRITDNRSTSRTTRYTYNVAINEDGLYEVSESNAYKSDKYYIKVENGVSEEIKLDELLEKLGEQ